MRVSLGRIKPALVTYGDCVELSSFAHSILRVSRAVNPQTPGAPRAGIGAPARGR
jgi:hypothetical protein